MRADIHPVLVLGVAPGTSGPSLEHREALLRAHVVFGGRSLLDSLEETAVPKRPITAPLEPLLDEIAELREKGRRVVVLADGDPLFFGIGKRLARALGPENLDIRPALSPVQIAAARTGIPWGEAEMVSLHGRGGNGPFFKALTRNRWVGVLTDQDNSPEALAEIMAERGASGFRLHVFERVGTAEERTGAHSPEEAAAMSFAQPNILFVRGPARCEADLRSGIPEGELVTDQGLVTKWPVRAAGIAAMGLTGKSVVWDVGAGSGAISLEASIQAMEVHALEKSPRRAAMIRENARRFGAWNVSVTTGEAPWAFEGLPDPDRIFFGGGLSVQGVLKQGLARLAPGGVAVAHCVLLGSLEAARKEFSRAGLEFESVLVQGAMESPLAGDARLSGLNPVFILRGTRPA